MLRVLSSEWLKISRKMIWFLVFLGPIGVVGLQGLNFSLRYSYLMNLYKDDLWGGLIGNIILLTIPTLFIGLTILASMTAGIEHQTNAWKQTLALPVTRFQVFAGKFVLNALLLLCSTTLLVLLTLLLGWACNMPLTDAPIAEILKWSFYPYLAVLPFVALQVWLSVVIANQAIPLTVGIVGLVISMFAGRFPDWAPYKWASLQNNAGEPLYSVAAGVALGLVVVLLGSLHFIRKDVS